MFESYHIQKILKLYVSKARKLSQFLILTVNIPSQKLAFVLNPFFNKWVNSIVPIQGPHQGLKSSLQGAKWQVPLLFERKKNYLKRPLVVTHCQPLLLIDIRCTTLRHSFYHLLLFAVTRCTIPVTRCITRLPYYKRFLLNRAKSTLVNNFINHLNNFY